MKLSILATCLWYIYLCFIVFLKKLLSKGHHFLQYATDLFDVNVYAQVKIRVVISNKF